MSGNLSKGSGSFRIPHPDPSKNEDYDLMHNFVESPTAGENIYRFKLFYDTKAGNTFIQLPDYFPFLNENVQVWVTADVLELVIGIYDEKLNQVRFETYGNGINLSILVIGTRKDEIALKYWKGVEVLKNQAKKDHDFKRRNLRD